MSISEPSCKSALLDLALSRGKAGERPRVVAEAIGTLAVLAAGIAWIVAAVTLARR